MTQQWANSSIWGARPITAALFTVIIVAAVGPWGLFTASPLAIILVIGFIQLIRDRRHPIDREIRRVSNEMWAAESADIARDPHLHNITTGLSLRRARRALPK